MDVGKGGIYYCMAKARHWQQCRAQILMAEECASVGRKNGKECSTSLVLFQIRGNVLKQKMNLMKICLSYQKKKEEEEED